MADVSIIVVGRALFDKSTKPGSIQIGFYKTTSCITGCIYNINAFSIYIYMSNYQLIVTYPKMHVIYFRLNIDMQDKRLF